MPGLPMFGHGQVEGLHEKYGMEYRRPKWDEHANEHLVWRHEREIFPLLEKRWVFSGSTHFALYDFVQEDGSVAEDVYAYSNREGSERALVLFLNKFGTARGRVQHSVSKLREDGGAESTSLANAIGLSGADGDWLVFRDVPNRLEYLRPMRDVTEGGLVWELGAFKYHVLMDFRGTVATADRPYDKLAETLGGRGVPSIERALAAHRFHPVHRPLAEALAKGHIEYLEAGWDEKTRAPKKEAFAALDERIGSIANGLAYMIDAPVDAAVVKKTARERYGAILALSAGNTAYLRENPYVSMAPNRDRAKVPEVASTISTARAAAENAVSSREAAPFAAARFLEWLHVEAMLDLLVAVAPDTSRADLATQWELAIPICPEDTWDGHQQAALSLALATLPHQPLREAMRAALTDPRVRTFLGVHEAGDTAWLVKEPWVVLAAALAERQAVLGTASLAGARRQELDVVALAERLGWRAGDIEAALVPKAAKTSISSTS